MLHVLNGSFQDERKRVAFLLYFRHVQGSVWTTAFCVVECRIICTRQPLRCLICLQYQVGRAKQLLSLGSNMMTQGDGYDGCA